jgi:hypothetical protein
VTLALLVAWAPADAGAHGEASPLVRSVVDRIEPRPKGVTIQPVRGPAAQVLLRNRTGEALEVLDRSGRAFLRVGPRGVEGNLASPDWYASGNPDGRGVPGGVGGPPRWRLVSRRSEWTYYEHRLHPGTVRLPREARGARRPVRLSGFVVPLRHGRRPLRVVGHLEFRPVRGSVLPVLRSGAQPLPGVTAAILPGPFPVVLLQNTGRRPVTVLGRAGEPFARVGPRGVEVNQRSPSHVDELRLRGELPRVAADPDAAPVWRKVKAVPSFTWTEHRARYALEQPPDEVVRAERRVRLLSWSVPLRAGGREAELRGTTDWVPTEASGVPLEGSEEGPGGGVPAGLLALLAGTAAAAGAALAARMRRRPGRDKVVGR